MKKRIKFSDNLTELNEILNIINHLIEITLGPIGKTGLFFKGNKELKFLTNGYFLVQTIKFEKNIYSSLKFLLEQASKQTYNVTGDGSKTTFLLLNTFLSNSLKLIQNGYNQIFLSNGFEKLSFFLNDKVLNYSIVLNNHYQVNGLVDTIVGEKIDKQLNFFLKNLVIKLKQDSVFFIDENNIIKNEVQTISGIELERGFASSYFINNFKNFTVNYYNSHVLISNTKINSYLQIVDIINYIEKNNKSLILIVENIDKSLFSKLVLKVIQKKIKLVIIKYNSIKLLKEGILEDLALLTHSVYDPEISSIPEKIFTINDLGTVENFTCNKEKSTFIISKFSKILINRKINELNRNLLISETEYEKSILKHRIAKLTGNIIHIKLSKDNNLEENRKKIENLILTVQSSFEEGILPGGGSFYLFLTEEIINWSYLNLIGEEIFASKILNNGFKYYFYKLCNSSNLLGYEIYEKIYTKAYPYSFDFRKMKIVNCFNEYLIDSAKVIRLNLWNSLSLLHIILKSE